MEGVSKNDDDEVLFRNIIPKEGFFPKYMSYTDEIESPGSFHFWIAVTILAAALQRRVYMLRRNSKIFPNLYTVLVAPTGICRKTTAIVAGLDLVEKFDWLNIIADKTSPEALLQALEKGGQQVGMSGTSITLYQDATGLIRAPELAVFLNKSSYTQDLASLLTDLYDCRSEFKYITRNKKPITLNNIAVCFLGCTTPDWLASSIPPDAFGGGFMSRFLFIVRNRRGRVMGMEFDAGNKYEVLQNIRQDLRTMLLSIHLDMVGEVKVYNAAIKWYNDWYFQHCEPKSIEPHVSGFEERKPTNLCKIAMLLAISQGRMVITIEDFETALKLINWVDERSAEAFRHINLSRVGSIKLKIIDLVRAKGGVASRRDVLRALGGQISGIADLEIVENIVRETGEMIVQVLNTPGRASIQYRIPEEER